MSNSDKDDLLMKKACEGDEQALGELFEQNRARLKRTIYLRLDPRVQTRVDASDVLQDTYVHMARKLADAGGQTDIPFFLWLRMIACERIIQLHRMHLQTAKRETCREVSLEGLTMPEASSLRLANQLAGSFTSVDRGMVRAELRNKIQDVLNRIDPGDREVLAMRHFEELSTKEIAIVLGLTRSGVLKRYTRAIRRLRDAIRGDPDLEMI